MSDRPVISGQWAFAPSGRRVAVSHEAACQIDALAEVIADKLDRSGETAVLAMAVRIRQLAMLAVAALGDPDEKEDRLYQELTGRYLPKEQGEVGHG